MLEGPPTYNIQAGPFSNKRQYVGKQISRWDEVKCHKIFVFGLFKTPVSFLWILIVIFACFLILHDFSN